MTQVVLVDDHGNEIGLEEKFAAHQKPFPLHRAISIVIFDKAKTKMLITQRSAKKPTWPMFWSNAVCSHPYPGESFQEAADRRIFEEVGFRTKLTEINRFSYEAEMKGGIWGEHEYDAVFEGTYDGEVNPNPDEIADYKWIILEDLKKDLESEPDKFTPWFKLVFDMVYTSAK